MFLWFCQLAETNKDAAETWCVVGNCYSLQKDHESAIKFFQRAIQINPRFSYAYTLLGHEYLQQEQSDKVESNCLFVFTRLIFFLLSRLSQASEML